MVTTKYNELIYAARPRKKFDLRRKLRKMLPERIFRLGQGTYLGYQDSIISIEKYAKL